jgi:hypothetical protein
VSELPDISTDIVTCSSKFREDIRDFFLRSGEKLKSQLKIAEIGSYKGYTTNFLSDYFNKVYAVDVNGHKKSKEINKDKNNIEYIDFDLYSGNWSDLNINPDIAFIDASHSYPDAKSDTENCLKYFSNLKYLIYDDFGVWPGVRKVVGESIAEGKTLHEKYIGVNEVRCPIMIEANGESSAFNTLATDGVIHNQPEGVIVRVDKEGYFNNFDERLLGNLRGANLSIIMKG